MQPSVKHMIATEKVGGEKTQRIKTLKLTRTALSVRDWQNLSELGDATVFRCPPFTRDQTPLQVALPSHTPPLPCLHEKTQQVWSPTFSTNHHNTTKSRIRQSYRWPKVNLKELIDKILDNSKGLPSIIIPHYFSLYHLLSLHYGSGVSISLLLPKHPILKEIFGRQQSEKF